MSYSQTPLLLYCMPQCSISRCGIMASVDITSWRFVMPVLDTDMLFSSIDKDCDIVVIPKIATTIPDSAFRGCENLKTVIMPDGLKAIGQFAFKGCKSLNHVLLPDRVSHIGKGAFAFCESLNDIRLPNGLTTIDDCAFVGCALKNITLPKNLKLLGVLIFRKCLNLESVIFPDSIKSITVKQDLFQDCDSLKQISACADCKIERGSIPENCQVVFRNK